MSAPETERTGSANETPILASALAAHRAGLCVLPPREDGSKAPQAKTWTEYQSRRPSEEQLQSYYRNGNRTGLGFVCGAISGGLELFDFDEHEIYTEFRRRAKAAEIDDLVERIEAGYYEESPRGGHLFYRCEGPKSTKLAKRPKRPEEQTDEHDKIKTLIETKGEGGYAVVAPSHGLVHESERPYKLVSGGVESIVTITPDEREELHRIARTFDQMPRKATSTEQPKSKANGELRPGDDYNARATWQEILNPHGWVHVFERNGETFWRRPGKNQGISATTNYGDSGFLYVFSTSTTFETECGIDKLGAFAALNHDGDIAAAAKALAARGFGKQQNRGYDPRSKSQEEQIEWEEPIPLIHVESIPFPLEALPQWLADFVEAEAIAKQTPLDLPGLLGIGACATALARKVRVKVRNGWVEPVNLYMMTALPPASRKSPTFDAIKAPIEEFEKAEIKRQKPDIAQRQAEYKIMEITLEKAQKVAARANPEDRNSAVQEAIEIAQKLAEMNVPVAPRLLAEDSTPERLAGLLAEHDGRMGVFSAEGGDVFDIMAGRYASSGKPNIGVYLKGHSGDSLRVDRQHRPPVFVSKPALTICFALQPWVIEGLAEQRGFRGMGLLARFLYAIPENTVGHRDVDPPFVQDSIQRDYHDQLTNLLNIPVRKNQDGEVVERELLMSPEANKKMIAFMRVLEPQLAETGALGDIADWAGKLAGTVARIAGILHMATWADKTSKGLELPIDGTTLDAALTLGDYLTRQARMAFGLMGASAVISSARYVWRWIADQGLAEFSKRDLFEGTKGRFPQVVDLSAPLDRLIDHGYIRQRQEPPREPGKRGRSSSPVFEVNPLAYSNSANSANSARGV